MGDETVYHDLEPEVHQKIADVVSGATPILDVGCGEGRLTNFLAAKLNSETYGIDISDFNLTKAQEAAQAQGISHLVQYVKGDASKLHFLDESFAAVVILYSLHEIENPRNALKEVWRVLKVKGKLIVADFIKGGKAEELWGERYYTPREIETMLHEVGFGEMATGFIYDDIVLVSSRKVRTQRINELERTIMELKSRIPPHSVPPYMIEELEELEEELQRLKEIEEPI